jgi:hypothetical protein
MTQAIFKRFHDAILEENPALNEADIKPGGHMNVYVEGYPIRLTQAIRTDYPATLSILGDKEFNTLAREFIKANPSQHYNLDQYPQGFFAFAADKLQPFARDVAKLEDAIARVFMAEESDPLDPSALAQITPESFSKMRLNPRKASQLLEFSYRANSWFNEWNARNKPAIPAAEPQFVYICRHNNNVMRHTLTEPEYIVLKQLINGIPVEKAIEHAVSAQKQHAEEIVKNIQKWFTQWLKNGFFRVDT